MFLILTLGAISTLLAFILTPIVRDVVGKWGFLDHPDGGRKQHSSPIPRVGGIAIVIAYVGTFTIAFFLPFSYTFVLRNALPSILPLTMVAAMVFFTGVLDDLVGLSAWQKLIGLCGAGALAYCAGIRVEIHFLNLPGWPWLGFATTVIWLVGCANAFNLIDGMDGLAAGVGLLATLTMLIAALAQGNLPLALTTLPLAGCLLGFLRYNFNPASVFLGDSGSLLIGFLLGCLGALWSEKSVTLVALTVPLLAVSIPLLDVALSILRRFLGNRPIFQPDRGHIHHKLLDRGLSPRGVVLTIYGICGLAAIASLLIGGLHNQFSGLIVIAFCSMAWAGVRCLDYTEFEIAGRMFLKGRFRRIIGSEIRLTHFQKALAETVEPEECWTKIRDCCSDLGLRAVRMRLGSALFEDDLPVQPSRSWELRISLPDAQYLDLSGQQSLTCPVALNALIEAVEKGLKRTLVRRLETTDCHEAENGTATVSKKLVYTARASASASVKNS